MRIFFIINLLLSFCLLTLACNQRVNDSVSVIDPEEKQLVESVGHPETFEIATWNIENFPKAGPNSVNYTRSIIKDLDIDLIAVQEIASVSSFNELLADLPEWRGVLSGDSYSSGNYQKTGIIYKPSFISVSNSKNIFTDDGYAFPRPPLSAYIEIKDKMGVKFNFNLIVLHLKAMGGDANEARRRSACNQLSQFITDEINSGADPDFIVLGDWNDQLTDIGDKNVFNSFLENADQFSFLTHGLGEQYSYISTTFKSLIDHILITSDSQTEYATGSTRVLYLDNQFQQYQSQVSDHRPVVAEFKGFNIEEAN